MAEREYRPIQEKVRHATQVVRNADTATNCSAIASTFFTAEALTRAADGKPSLMIPAAILFGYNAYKGYHGSNWELEQRERDRETSSGFREFIADINRRYTQLDKEKGKVPYSERKFQIMDSIDQHLEHRIQLPETFYPASLALHPNRIFPNETKRILRLQNRDCDPSLVDDFAALLEAEKLPAGRYSVKTNVQWDTISDFTEDTLSNKVAAITLHATATEKQKADEERFNGRDRKHVLRASKTKNEVTVEGYGVYGERLRTIAKEIDATKGNVLFTPEDIHALDAYAKEQPWFRGVFKRIKQGRTEDTIGLGIFNEYLDTYLGRTVLNSDNTISTMNHTDIAVVEEVLGSSLYKDAGKSDPTSRVLSVTKAYGPLESVSHAQQVRDMQAVAQIVADTVLTTDGGTSAEDLHPSVSIYGEVKDVDASKYRTHVPKRSRVTEIDLMQGNHGKDDNAIRVGNRLVLEIDLADPSLNHIHSKLLEKTGVTFA